MYFPSPEEIEIARQVLHALKVDRTIKYGASETAGVLIHGGNGSYRLAPLVRIPTDFFGCTMLGANYPTKKALKESIGKPLLYVETSMFGEEYRENGTLTVVGPDAFHNRKWFATVRMENGRIASVSLGVRWDSSTVQNPNTLAVSN